MAPIKRETESNTESSSTISAITTKMGVLRYKQAARQVRAIERENAAATALCHLAAQRNQIKPHIIDIKLETPTKSKNRCLAEKKLHCKRRKEKSDNLSASTLMSTDSKKSFERQRPWHQVSCTDVKIEKITSTTYSGKNTKNTSSTAAIGSDYRGWLNTVPLCFKSESSESSVKVAKPKKKLKPREAIQRETPRIASNDNDDTAHLPSGQQRLRGDAWKRPCPASVIAGAPQRYTGTCPPTMEQIAKMSEARRKFFLTQDPRRTQCLVNPEALHTKRVSSRVEFDAFTKIVKTGENVCVAKKLPTTVPIICETIDLDNPLNLDFQGLDYKNTYQNDEQDFQNQRIFKQLVRHMDRKRAKIETQEKAEADLQAERLAIPARFAVSEDSKENETVPELTKEEVKLAELLRSVKKPWNKKRLEEELLSRRERYKDLYLKHKARELARKKADEEAKQEAMVTLGYTVALKTIEEANERVNDAIKLATEGEQLERRKEDQRRRYPHTIRETRDFKQKLAKEKRIKHDKALVKQQFYGEQLGKHKDYPELHVQVGTDQQECDMELIENSESGSSDDEDNLEVGKVGSDFKLRGFHFKLGNNLRGKTHQREKFTGPRKEKGCITREQWLNELAPQRQKVKADVAEGIVKPRTPDDPNYVLFPLDHSPMVPKVKRGAVQEFVARRLGLHYERSIRSKLKTRKPRLPYHVKKFNLIRYLFSENDRQMQALRANEMGKDYGALPPLTTTLEYIAENDMKRKDQREQQKRKRMQVLGIPCNLPKVKASQVKCEESDTETDSDWVPEPEPPVVGDLTEYEERMRAGQIAEKLPIDMVGNMPAPECRETTLRRHPRHPRDYAKMRVPSAQFDDVVQTSGLPHMHKLDPEQRFYENVRLPKRPYTTLFKARHHHDHTNPVQTSTVDVHYQPKIIRAEATKEPLTMNEEQALKATFEKAFPACKQYVDQDLTTVHYDIEAMLTQHRNECKKAVGEVAKELVKDLCQQKEFRFHSRDPQELLELEYPGRQEYLDFLNEIRATLEEQKQQDIDEEGEEVLCIDRKTYIEELEADLKSIESCLTSVSSSICTNLTNDSGSFLLMEGATKVPLDYIRKSTVPFEELQRSRFKVVPINCEAEEKNPFRVLPFSGQKRAQLSLSTQKDKFFTFTTRQRNGVRLRLEIEPVNVRKTLIGRGERKHPGAVVTDIDEDYVTELKKRSVPKYFPFKSGRDYIKNALRLKFESKVIQGQIVRTKIYDRLNDLHWKAMQITKTLYQKLFLKWAKREYDAAMAVVHKVTQNYGVTDDILGGCYDLDRQQSQLTMDIIFIEGNWIRRVMLQNFHYLLGETDWRKEHDWIHRIELGEDENGEPIYSLERYDISIAKRSKVNVRNRDKDDVRAIKAFYENVFLLNKQPIEIVFPDAESFMRGMAKLKIETFNMLLEMHFTTSVHAELNDMFETFEELCMAALKPKEDYVKRKFAKKNSMEQRADEMKRRVMAYLDEPIEHAYNDAVFNYDRAVIAEVWREIVPTTLRGASNTEIGPAEQLAMISEVVLDLIAAFDNIPMKKSRVIEHDLRRKRAYMRKVSKQAYKNECRINLDMKKVLENLKAQIEKPKPPRKLQRSHLKKVEKPVSVPEIHISEHTKFFFRAFHEDGDVMQLPAARDSMLDVNTMQDQIVPFYFDHFLKVNGYVPNYGFKTRVELRDGPEINRLNNRALVPEVLEKMEKWEDTRKKIMEENIQKNPRMYDEVNV